MKQSKLKGAGSNLDAIASLIRPTEPLLQDTAPRGTEPARRRGRPYAPNGIGRPNAPKKRVTVVASVEQWCKLQMIALREHKTFSATLEIILGSAIHNYEEMNGEIVLPKNAHSLQDVIDSTSNNEQRKDTI